MITNRDKQLLSVRFVCIIIKRGENVIEKRLKKLIPLIIFICVFTLLLCGILHFSLSGTPESASVQQVIDALTDNGFQPNDVTDNAIANFQNAGLKTCLLAKNDDFHFEFFDFDNKASALKAYRNAQTLIVTERLATPNVEIRNRKIGYDFYSLDAIGIYSVAVRVNNTAVYAYCDTENAPKINELLKSIGYSQIEGSSQSPAEISPLFSLLFTVVWFPLILICRHWLWPIVYRSAGKSQKEIDSFLDESPKRVPRRKTIAWLIKDSVCKRRTVAWTVIYELPLVLEFIAVLIAFVSLFTDALSTFFDVYIIIVIGTGFAVAIIGSILDKVLYQVK